jgi:hypothetical protein
MRFPAVVVVRRKQPAPVRARQPMRQPAPATELAVRTEPSVPQPQEVPADLDQRVRLAGEW